MNDLTADQQGICNGIVTPQAAEIKPLSGGLSDFYLTDKCKNAYVTSHHFKAGPFYPSHNV